MAKQVGTAVESHWKNLVLELRQEILQQTCGATLREIHNACWALGNLADAQRKIFDAAGTVAGEKFKK